MMNKAPTLIARIGGMGLKKDEAQGRLTITLGPGQRKVSLVFVTRQLITQFIQAHRNGRLRLSFAPMSSSGGEVESP